MVSYELDMPGRAIVGADSRLRVGEESVGLGWFGKDSVKG
jgi:hypothetical protein